jgi:hypothetical protein
MLNSPRLSNIQPTSTKTLIFTGGLNEEVSNMELRGGELTDVQNYVEKDSGVSGYVSFQGYERFDGQTSPSSVAVVVDPVTHLVTDDTAREAARTAITAIPGSGITRGVHIYEGDVYGWRDDATPTNIEMYKATAGGWSKITAGTGTAGGSIQAVNSRFSLYKTNNVVMVWVDGVSDIHTYDGTTVATITHASLPATGTYPTHVGVWNNRLFLAYPKGNVFFSAVGDPTDFLAGSGAGTFQVGDDITGFTVTPGGDLLLTMKDRIEFITDTTSTVPGSTFSFTKQTFSPNSGAIDGTVKRMLGTVYFADDRGVTTLQAAQEYGDFIANSLAKKVEQTYQSNKDNIVLATVNRQDNQYTLLFNGTSNASGLVFSFKGKRLKGATKIKLNHLVYNIAEGKDNNRNDQVYFGSSDGFVFKMYTGTSFDGTAIETRLGTSFYHYNSPTIWKHFKEAMFEVTGEAYTSLSYRPDFDYNEEYFPTTQLETDETEAVGGVWGSGLWGVFTWGGGGILTRLKDKILGYGTNMRMLVVSSSKYKAPHNINNMTVQYTNGATKV